MYANIVNYIERERDMAMFQTPKSQMEANGTRYMPMPPHDANNVLRIVSHWCVLNMHL
jgi:hypothetical protein